MARFPAEIVLAMGSNLGNRGRHLWQALHGLRNHGIEVIRHSSLYETVPAYVADQPNFLNAALLAKTDLKPLELLAVLKDLEAKAGRQTGGIRFGPRPLDLDIIFYGGQALRHDSLEIPHPRWSERGFVKTPMADLFIDYQSREQEGEANVPEAYNSVSSRLQHARQLCDVEEEIARSGSRATSGRRGDEIRTGLMSGPAWPSTSMANAGPSPGQGDVMRRVTPLPGGDDGEGGRMLTWGRKTLVMGILNVTPDSFSDGGRLLGSQRSELADSDDNSDGQGGSSSASMVGDVQTGVGSSVGSLQRAVDCARRMVLDGADLLDIGGQSTRPGSTRVSASEEASRVIPVIKAMRRDPLLKTIPVSCDTYYASVAREAVASGADMINDVSGGTLDAGMMDEVAALGVPYVLMHMRGGDLAKMQDDVNTRYGCAWREVGSELQSLADRAMRAGIPAWNIILDPGIGFSKTPAGNLELIRHLDDMRRGVLQGAFRRGGPVLVGPSRKGFLGQITGRDTPAERDAATVAACVACIAGGGLVDVVRVHNVRDTVDGVRVADAVYR